VSDQANLKRLHQAESRRSCRKRQAWRVLDAAYQAYLRELGPPHSPPDLQSGSRNHSPVHSPTETKESTPIEPPSPPIHESPSPPRPCTPPPPEPDSPHSVLTLRMRLDTPLRTPSISPLFTNPFLPSNLAEFYLKRGIYRRTPHSTSSSTLLLSLRSQRILRNPHYAIPSTHRPSPLRFVYHRTRWFWSDRN